MATKKLTKADKEKNKILRKAKKELEKEYLELIDNLESKLAIAVHQLALTSTGDLDLEETVNEIGLLIDIPTDEEAGHDFVEYLLLRGQDEAPEYACPECRNGTHQEKLPEETTKLN